MPPVPPQCIALRWKSDGAWQHGLTLVELVTVLAIMAIATATALPAFRELVDRARVDEAAGDIAGLLTVTRSEAARRNADMTICRVADPPGNTCLSGATTDWSGPWIVFQDTDGNGVRTGAEEIVRVRDAQDAVTVMLDAPAAFMRFTPRGFLAADATLGLRILAPRTTGAALSLCLSRAGRMTRRTASCGS